MAGWTAFPLFLRLVRKYWAGQPGLSPRCPARSARLFCRRPLHIPRASQSWCWAGFGGCWNAGSRNRPARDALRRDGRDRLGFQRQDECAGAAPRGLPYVQPRPAARAHSHGTFGRQAIAARPRCRRAVTWAILSYPRRLKNGPMRAAQHNSMLELACVMRARFVANVRARRHPAIPRPPPPARRRRQPPEVRQPV